MLMIRLSLALALKQASERSYDVHTEKPRGGAHCFFLLKFSLENTLHIDKQLPVLWKVPQPIIPRTT